ncbi:MAG: hypothetical protein PHD58_10440 [Anaerolineales bacterium]|nr:hypothetical protein [Anaerolineales bacterium]
MEIPYRLRQLWQALAAAPDRRGIDEATAWLTPAQITLFLRQPAFEQAHSLKVMRRLLANGEHHPDLLAAALLHDVGKTYYALRLWERAYIVLVGVLFPNWAQRGGARAPEALGKLPFWRRPLEVARGHPEWGAEMARQAGVSSLAAWLIQNHQNQEAAPLVTLNERLLAALRRADGNN